MHKVKNIVCRKEGWCDPAGTGRAISERVLSTLAPHNFLCYSFGDGAGGIGEDSIDPMYNMWLLCESLSEKYRNIRFICSHECTYAVLGCGGGQTSGRLAGKRTWKSFGNRLYSMWKMRTGLSTAYYDPKLSDGCFRKIIEKITSITEWITSWQNTP